MSYTQSPDDWCEQYGYGGTMTICEGDVFVGPPSTVVYVDAEEDSGAGGGGSENGDDGDSDSESESDNESGAGGADSDVLQLNPTAGAEECIEAGGTWHGFYCDMPMDEHIRAKCACYVDGRWGYPG